jgi:hypothetical protein
MGFFVNGDSEMAWRYEVLGYFKAICITKAG